MRAAQPQAEQLYSTEGSGCSGARDPVTQILGTAWDLGASDLEGRVSGTVIDTGPVGVCHSFQTWTREGAGLYSEEPQGSGKEQVFLEGDEKADTEAIGLRLQGGAWWPVSSTLQVFWE